MLNWLRKKLLEHPFKDECQHQKINGFDFAYYPSSDILYTEQFVYPINRTSLKVIEKCLEDEIQRIEAVKFVYKDRKKIFKGLRND